MRILLIEDDRMIGTSLLHGLQDEGYAVDWVQDGDSAARALRDAAPDYALILLDWNLPRRSGLDVLRGLRQRKDSPPVLMITARDAVNDLVAGLDSGADDYLIKPFELAELLARMRSLLRRAIPGAPSRLSNGVLSLDPATRRVARDGREHELTAREYALLFALMERPGVVMSRTQLEERLYSWSDPIGSNAVEFTIHGVRRKLGMDAIENLRGLGWRVAARS
jgi:two-component system, OmpR family, response regulator